MVCRPTSLAAFAVGDRPGVVNKRVKVTRTTRTLAPQWVVAITMLYSVAAQMMEMHSVTRANLVAPRPPREMTTMARARSLVASSPAASLPGPLVPPWRPRARRQPDQGRPQQPARKLPKERRPRHQRR